MADEVLSPLFRKVDCLRLPVGDLDGALSFYRDRLGHNLVWRTATAAGLRMPETGAEIVLHTGTEPPEMDLLVDSAEAAADRFVAAGGRIVAGPFEIQVGKAVVVADPWNNLLVLLDLSKGLLATDAEAFVVGNLPLPE
jgi:predicted enzyme related to lactoylglutathione lyase